jgi:hypothetical protein
MVAAHVDLQALDAQPLLAPAVVMLDTRGLAVAALLARVPPELTTFEVASSKISSFGLATIARAIVSIWRCPCERFAPRSVSTVS